MFPVEVWCSLCGERCKQVPETFRRKRRKQMNSCKERRQMTWGSCDRRPLIAANSANTYIRRWTLLMKKLALVLDLLILTWTSNISIVSKASKRPRDPCEHVSSLRKPLEWFHTMLAAVMSGCSYSRQEAADHRVKSRTLFDHWSHFSTKPSFEVTALHC